MRLQVGIKFLSTQKPGSSHQTFFPSFAPPPECLVQVSLYVVSMGMKLAAQCAVFCGAVSTAALVNLQLGHGGKKGTLPSQH